MRSHKDVEAYLLRMERPYREVNEGTFVVGIGNVSVAVNVMPPLLLVRVDIGPVPATDRAPLFEHLLRLNATALVHSAYGIDDPRGAAPGAPRHIILAAALELENLDYNELDAVLAEIDLALAQQLTTIRSLAEGVPPSSPVA